MQTGEKQALRLRGSSELTTGWADALAGAYTSDSKYVITSPNADFVPEPFVGLVRMFLRKDFRYGPHDPVLWPQIFTPGYEYLCAIRRRGDSDILVDALWTLPSEADDFELLPGSVFKCLGLVRNCWMRPLEVLVDQLCEDIRAYEVKLSNTEPHLRYLCLSMRDALDRILSFPSTYRDACLQVRQLQRYAILGRAYLDYSYLLGKSPALRVHPEYMGAFTTDPAVVQQLYKAGIPVWFIRSDASILESNIVRSVVMLDKASTIELQPWQSGAGPLYSGLVGSSHLAYTCRARLRYLDLAHAPLLVLHDSESFSQQSTAAKVPTSAQHPSCAPHLVERAVVREHTRSKKPYAAPHASHLRGRDKFAEFVHEWMPPALATWTAGLQQVDRQSPARRGGHLWGYWVPEPALLLGPKTLERTSRYLLQWLGLRPAWLYLLGRPGQEPVRVRPQWWRDYLNGDIDDNNPKAESQRAKRLEQVRQVFGRAFGMDEYARPSGYTRWHGRTIRTLEPKLAQQIVWEVFEIGFRQELLALDRILVPPSDDADPELFELVRHERLSFVFADRDPEQVRRLPTSNVGLASPVVEERVSSLESLRQVLTRWPLCPTSLRTSKLASDTPQNKIVEAEEVMVKFYIQTFFDYSGRAPTVPHAFPI